MLQTLKSAGAVILGIGGVIAAAAVGMMLIYGATYLSAVIMPYMGWAVTIAFILCIFCFLPLSAFHRGRKIAANGFLCASLVFGVCTWMLGLLVTMNYWGVIAVFIGLGMAGIGVVPIGMLAAFFHGAWFDFFVLLIGIIITFGVRMFAYWIADKYDNGECDEAAA